MHTVTVSRGTNTISEQRLRDDRLWDVDQDPTVVATSLQNFHTRLPLRFASIEIKTPVEWENPQSFEVVRFAVNLLASKFRILLNPSMGLHVHIGNGPTWMPLHWVKRMAILYWAADRLLATLNPPTRSHNYYCPGIRDYSMLAGDWHKEKMYRPSHEGEGLFRSKPLLCMKYIARQVRFGESSTMWRETHTDEETIEEFLNTRMPGHFEPFYDDVAPKTAYEDAEEPEDPREPIARYASEGRQFTNNVSSGRSSPKLIDEALSLPPEETQDKIAQRIAAIQPTKVTLRLQKRLNQYPRCKLPRWTDEDLRRIDEVNFEYSGKYNNSEGDRAADRSLWLGAEQLAGAKASCEIEAMLKCNDRSNYNFRSYACCYIGRPEGDYKRTVEWRQGAGSMDAQWVSVWARIAVGVSRYAIHAPVDQFLRILQCCDYAERGGSYDVLDFLEDIGLVAEAQVAGQRIYKYGEEWGLEYEETTWRKT